MAPPSRFLAGLEKVTRRGGARWRSEDRERYYEWDPLHEHVEAYDKRGHHVGALDAETGVLIAPAKKGRRIDV